MREDLRLDLRDGPALAKIRKETGDTGKPVVRADVVQRMVHKEDI